MLRTASGSEQAKRKHRVSEDNPVLSGGEKHYELRLAAVIREQSHISADITAGSWPL
jgi:hypothetical protein